ncbi:MFS transporter [Fuscibacter oryzae]|uniref:MFS transporter n=1 Tax=Fuscibacter oryzae TaxID=2803939 RepID=A0A8J7MP14_9RHOB|nr:MFS transporter [Fuscibacter oryzae]MBL4927028.1 MFS transporter [Fuscibacter oryzae]
MATQRQRIWGWWFFDWASQPYNTLLLTFVFAPYFAEVARGYYMGTGLEEEAAKAAAQSYWSFWYACFSVIIALMAPVLGAVAQGTGRRLVWVWLFSVLYVGGAASLWWMMPGGELNTLRWGAIMFGIGLIGMEFATIFTNALMPTLAEGDDIGKVSGSGFAFGYLGGLIALTLMLGFFISKGDTGLSYFGLPPLLGDDPETREGTRAVGPFTAIWFIVSMVPFWLWVKEPPGGAGALHVGRALSSLWELIKGLRFRKSLSAYLGSSLAYSDALTGIYAFGGIYASNVMGWEIGQIGVFGILGGVTAMIASWWGGKLDSRFGPKPVIVGSIIVLILVCAVIVGMERDSLWGIPMDSASNLPDIIFYICGALIGAAGGPLQAASRTMVLRHTTPDRATEAFGLFALSGKVTSFIAPALISIATTITGSARLGISPIILLFLVGLVLLVWVNPRGEQA